MNAIRKHGPVGRLKVASLTGIAPSAVTGIVNELIQDGMVLEVGRGESTGGRRPANLAVNPEAGYIFAVRIQHGTIAAALLDLGGHALETRWQRLEKARPETAIANIGSSLAMLAANTGIDRPKIIRCGVAVPGLINYAEGMVERASNLAWNRVPLATMLSQRLGGIPVRIENISNAAAFGEMVYGTGDGCANLIYVNLSVGIGAGIIIGRQLFSGSKGYAGEIGGAPIPLAAGLTGGNPARHKTFEELCGIRAIMDQVCTQIPDEVFQELGLPKSRIDIDEILLAPLINIQAIRRIVREAGCLIGVKVAELINLFNPEMVILGGELTTAGNVLLDAVIETVEMNTLAEIRRSVKIVISSMRKDPSLMGAYGLVLEDFFNSGDWLRTRPDVAAQPSKGL